MRLQEAYSNFEKWTKENNAQELVKAKDEASIGSLRQGVTDAYNLCYGWNGSEEEQEVWDKEFFSSYEKHMVFEKAFELIKLKNFEQLASLVRTYLSFFKKSSLEGSVEFKKINDKNMQMNCEADGKYIRHTFSFEGRFVSEERGDVAPKSEVSEPEKL